MGTAINETRDHNGEEHRLLISTDGTFPGKFPKKEWNLPWKVSKERMGPYVESFQRKNGTFPGKFPKKEWDLTWKVSKERMGPSSLESLKEKWDILL